MVDFDILKKYNTTNARIRELCTCENNESKDYECRKKLEERLQARIQAGIEVSLANAHYYSSADLAWDSAPIVKENIPLMLYAQKKIQVNRCASELEKLSCANEFIRRSETGEIIEVDLPRLYQVSVNLVRHYLTRRIAAQSTKYTNLFPNLKYESRSTSPESKLRAEVLSQRVEMMVDQYNYRHLQTQVIRDLFLYGHCFLFPASAWDREVQWVKKQVAMEFATNTDFEVEAKVVREGLAFIRTHPSRVFWDLAEAPCTLNTDTGCSYVGFWDVRRYRDLMGNTAYFNREKIKIGSGGRYFYDKHQLYFDSTFSATQIKFSSLDTLRASDPSADNDTKNLYPFYMTHEADETMFVTEYYERLIPNEHGLGDYPFPVWVRFVVASDATIIYGEFLPSIPAVYFGYNENDSRMVNISPAHELMSFQDQLSNLLSQLLLTAKANAWQIVTVDTDAVEPQILEALRKTMEGKDYYTHPRLLEYSGNKIRALGVNSNNPMSVVEKRSSEDITKYFQAIAQLLNLVERMMVLSPQELGQASPREITATESSEMSASTNTIYTFISDAIDEGRAAMKKMIYEALVTKATADIKVPVLDSYSPSTIESAGFTDATPAGSPRQEIIGTRELLVHDYVFSSRDGSERPANSLMAQTLTQLLGQLFQVPELIQAMGKKRLYEVINEIFRMSGTGVNLRLELREGEEDTFGPSPDEIQSTIQELVKAIQDTQNTVAGQQEQIDQLTELAKSIMPGESAPGVPGVPPIAAPLPPMGNSAMPIGGVPMF